MVFHILKIEKYEYIKSIIQTHVRENTLKKISTTVTIKF